VPTPGVGQQLGQQVAAGLGPVDQMMMRVDDPQIGLNDLFVCGRASLGEPPGAG